MRLPLSFCFGKILLKKENFMSVGSSNLYGSSRLEGSDNRFWVSRYEEVGALIDQHPIKARVYLIGLTLAEIPATVLGYTARLVHRLALATFYLISIPFVSGQRVNLFQNALENIRHAIGFAVQIPQKLVRIPVVIAYQFYIIIQSPRRLNSIKDLPDDIPELLQCEIFGGPKSLNDFSERHPVAGRLLSIPISLIDVTLELVKSPILVVDSVANAILCLVDPRERTPANAKKALNHAEIALKEVWSIPITVLVAPIKFVLQTGAILRDPTTVSSIRRTDFDDL